MKKYFLVLIVLILLLVACNNNEILEQQESSPALNSNTINNTINFYSYESFPKSDLYIMQWEKYIEANFNQKIDFTYLSTADESSTHNHDTNFEKIIQETNLEGILYVNSNELLEYLTTNDLILPISQLLQDNEYPSYISEKETAFNLNFNSKILSLPTSNAHIFKARMYDNEIAKDYNLSELSDSDSIIKLCEHVKNSNTNRYFSIFETTSILTEFRDIFLSYGMYPTYDYPIGYNAIINKYEDLTLNDNFHEAIQFIKHLYDQGYIIEKSKLLENISNDGNPFELELDKFEYSKYSFMGDTVYDDYTVSFLDNNYNQLKYIDTNLLGGSIVVLKNTIQPVNTLKKFIDLFYNTEKGRYSLTFGIENYNYYDTESILYIINNTSSYNSHDEANKTQDYTQGITENNVIIKPFGFTFIDVYNLKPLAYIESEENISSESITPEDILDYSSITATDRFNKYGIDSLLYSSHLSHNVPYDSSISKAFNTLIYNIIVLGNNISTEISSYKSKVNSIEITLLEQMNLELLD